MVPPAPQAPPVSPLPFFLESSHPVSPSATLLLTHIPNPFLYSFSPLLLLPLLSDASFGGSAHSRVSFHLLSARQCFHSFLSFSPTRSVSFSLHSSRGSRLLALCTCKQSLCRFLILFLAGVSRGTRTDRTPRIHWQARHLPSYIRSPHMTLYPPIPPSPLPHPPPHSQRPFVPPHLVLLPPCTRFAPLFNSTRCSLWDTRLP